jgi:DnaA-homolog protein
MTMSNQPARQLALNVQLRDDATLENYYSLPGQQVLMGALEQQLRPEGEFILFLHGAPDTGKTHLLQAACHMAEGGAMYLPLAELVDQEPASVLQGMECLQLICLDDLQAVAGHPDWELALFNFYNEAREQGCRLLVAADRAPRQLALGLADLASRLGWGIVFQMSRATDAQRQEMLCFRAGLRGLALSPEVAAYIMARSSRSLGDLLAVLEILDKASLEEKRALSIPFVKNALRW